MIDMAWPVVIAVTMPWQALGLAMLASFIFGLVIGWRGLRSSSPSMSLARRTDTPMGESLDNADALDPYGTSRTAQFEEENERLRSENVRLQEENERLRYLRD